MTTEYELGGLSVARTHHYLSLPQLDDTIKEGANGTAPCLAMHVSVVIPACNEEGAIAGVVKNIGKVLTEAGIDHEIIVVDDGSSDRTAQAAQSASAAVVQHPQNRGYGAALKTGIRSANRDIICIIDADGTYPVEKLPEMIAEAADADMVIGARTKGTVHIPLVRRPAKYLLNCLANFLTATKIPDLNSGMRVIRRKLVREYIDILPDRFSFTTTITLAALCDGYRVKFLPVEYHRRVGRSKLKSIDALNFLILILRTMTYFRPLRMFVPIALFLMAIGLCKFIFDVTYNFSFDINIKRISGTSVLFCLAGLNTLSVGIVADLICYLRRRGNSFVR